MGYEYYINISFIVNIILQFDIRLDLEPNSVISVTVVKHFDCEYIMQCST